MEKNYFSKKKFTLMDQMDLVPWTLFRRFADVVHADNAYSNFVNTVNLEWLQWKSFDFAIS